MLPARRATGHLAWFVALPSGGGRRLLGSTAKVLCYVIREISLRTLRRRSRRQASSGGSLMLPAAEPENREENSSYQDQTNPNSNAFPKTLCQVNAKNYPDDEVYEGNEQQDNPLTRSAKRKNTRPVRASGSE